MPEYTAVLGCPGIVSVGVIVVLRPVAQKSPVVVTGQYSILYTSVSTAPGVRVQGLQWTRVSVGVESTVEHGGFSALETDVGFEPGQAV